MAKLRIGLLGLGRTGRLAADEIIKDQACRLVLVVRRSDREAGHFASRLRGHDHDSGVIVPLSNAEDRAALRIAGTLGVARRRTRQRSASRRTLVPEQWCQ
jgi:hypothetical protein